MERLELRRQSGTPAFLEYPATSSMWQDLEVTMMVQDSCGCLTTCAFGDRHRKPAGLPFF